MIEDSRATMPDPDFRVQRGCVSPAAMQYCQTPVPPGAVRVTVFVGLQYFQQDFPTATLWQDLAEFERRIRHRGRPLCRRWYMRIGCLLATRAALLAASGPRPNSHATCCHLVP